MLPKDITNTAKEYILALHLSFGPLKRTTLGDWSVQGIDFVYTLQGWIKGVNGDGIGKDVGEDGIGASPLLTATDAMSYALGY